MSLTEFCSWLPPALEGRMSSVDVGGMRFDACLSLHTALRWLGWKAVVFFSELCYKYFIVFMNFVR